jgi:hypothetical protein
MGTAQRNPNGSDKLMTPMLLFPQWFVEWLIIGAIFGTAAGAVALATLLFHDWRRGDLW